MDTYLSERLLRRASPDVVAQLSREVLGRRSARTLPPSAPSAQSRTAGDDRSSKRTPKRDYTAVAELSGTELDGWASERRSMAGDIADSDAFSGTRRR